MPGRPDGHLPARVIADNRVTIPEEFREKFDLEEGKRIWVSVEPIGDDRILDNWILGGER